MEKKAAEFFIRQEALTSGDVTYYLLYSRYMMTSVTVLLFINNAFRILYLFIKL